MQLLDRILQAIACNAFHYLLYAVSAHHKKSRTVTAFCRNLSRLWSKACIVAEILDRHRFDLLILSVFVRFVFFNV